MKRNFPRGGPYVIAGCLLMLMAGFLARYNILAGKAATEAADTVAQSLWAQISQQGENPTDGIQGGTDDQPQAIEIDDSLYIGVLSIPQLELQLPIGHEWSDSAGKNTPCRYTGTVLEDDLVISGHNYKGHFGYINQLDPGAEISFLDVSGLEYHYTVSEIELISGSDIEGMQEGDWDLTLFTCTFSGADRITVRCVRVLD